MNNFNSPLPLKPCPHCLHINEPFYFIENDFFYECVECGICYSTDLNEIDFRDNNDSPNDFDPHYDYTDYLLSYDSDSIYPPNFYMSDVYKNTESFHFAYPLALSVDTICDNDLINDIMHFLNPDIVSSLPDTIRSVDLYLNIDESTKFYTN